MEAPAACTDVPVLLAGVVRLRLRGGWETARGFSRRAGLSQPHLANWLAGRKGLSLESCDDVLRVLGLSLAELLSRRGAR